MLITSDVSVINHIETFISSGKDNSYNLDQTNMLINKDGFILPYSNILRDKYRGIILQNCVNVTLGDELLYKYQYKPRLLSYDLYGTIDLWHLLLWVNNMTSVTQFNKKTFLVFLPENISLISKIIEKESIEILDNHNDPPLSIDETTPLRK